MDLATPYGIAKLFQNVSKGQLIQAIKKLDQISVGQRPEDSWNQMSIQLTECAMAHVRCFVIAENASALYSHNLSGEVRKVLQQLFHVMSIWWILKYSGDFQVHGGLSPDHLTELRGKFSKLLAQIRPIAVSLVDAFDFRDESLLSTLGAYDGQVYQRMFDAALKSPLNKTDVLPAFHKYVKPMMNSAKSTL